MIKNMTLSLMLLPVCILNATSFTDIPKFQDIPIGSNVIINADYQNSRVPSWRDDGYWANSKTSIKYTSGAQLFNFQGFSQVMMPLKTKLSKDKIYIIDVLLQTQGQVESLNIALRKITPPYKIYGKGLVSNPCQPGWQTLRIQTRIPIGLPINTAAVFMIAKGSGTILLKRLRIIQTNKFLVTNTVNGNNRGELLSNSAFVFGKHGWSTNGKAYNNELRLRKNERLLYAQTLDIFTGKRYFLRLRTKSKGKVKITIEKPRSKIKIFSRIVNLSSEMTNIEFQVPQPKYGTLEEKFTCNLLLTALDLTALDLISLSEGVTAPANAREAVVLFGKNLKESAEVIKGDKLLLTVWTTGIKAGTSGEIMLRDMNGKPYQSLPVTIKLLQNGKLGAQVILPLKHTGWYDAVLKIANKIIFGMPAEISVLPRDAGENISSDDFVLGAHASYWRVTEKPFQKYILQDERSRLMQLRRFGITSIRLHPPLSTKWWAVEPQNGQWNFNDAVVDAPLEYDISILGMFDGTARYATSAPQEMFKKSAWLGWGAFPAKNILDWETYVETMTKHFMNRIHVWEVWNEPDHNFFRINSKLHKSKEAEYVKLLKAARNRAKAIDPNIVIVGGAVTAGGKNFLLKAIKNGMLDYCDVVSFHGYGRALSVSSHGAEAFADMTKALQKAMQDHKHQLKPIWDSESGVGAISEGRAGTPQSELAIKGIIARRAVGLSRYYIYSCFRKDFPGHQDCRMLLGYRDRPLVIQPLLAVYAKVLGPATFYGNIGNDKKDIHLYAFKDQTGRYIIAGWFSKPGKTFPVTQNLLIKGKALDVSGNQIASITEGKLELVNQLRYFVSSR